MLIAGRLAKYDVQVVCGPLVEGAFVARSVVRSPKALLVLGPSAAAFAAEHGLALEALASLPNDLWTPDECPLGVRGIPVVDLLAP